MRYRPINSEPEDRRFGRYIPDDTSHLDKYPLSSTQALELAPTAVTIGINFYANFDNPVDALGNYYVPGRTPVGGSWWIGRSNNLGRIMGGHCMSVKPAGITDLTGWWDFYNQGSEGACVGFGCSRTMTLTNRKRYFARWLWDRAKEIDEWSETNPGDDEGTSVNAGLKILRDRGHIPWESKYATLNDQPSDWRQREPLTPVAGEGIARFRWITSMDDLLEVLGFQDRDYIILLNSWGRTYAHQVRMPVEVMDRLWHEDGEIAVITDK